MQEWTVFGLRQNTKEDVIPNKSRSGKTSMEDMPGWAGANWRPFQQSRGSEEGRGDIPEKC